MNPMPKGRGLQLGSNARRVWPHDNGPVPDIPGSNHIRVASEATGCAQELGLTLAIGLIDTAAIGAGAGRVPWINGHDRHTGNPCLVLDKATKLKKRPRRMLSSLGLANRCPGADVRQVFQRDTAPGVLGQRDNALADDVVRVACEPGFLPATFAQQPLGTPGA